MGSCYQRGVPHLVYHVVQYTGIHTVLLYTVYSKQMHAALYQLWEALNYLKLLFFLLGKL